MVTGAIEIAADAPSFSGAVAHLTVEDARRAGAPALRIAGMLMADLSHCRGVAERMPFALDCPDPATGVRWSVRAWIDTSGSGTPSGGDLFSATHVAVREPGDPVLVRVEPGGGHAP